MQQETKLESDAVPGAWQAEIERLGVLWCKFVHHSPMWPIHGRYECRTCGRRHPVPWMGQKLTPAPPMKAQFRAARLRSTRSALLPLVVLLAMLLPSSARAAGPSAGARPAPAVSRASASTAFARYLAGLTAAAPWRLETIEIEAWLPKLEKHGRLRAIRRLLPLGKPEYLVLEIDGDHTVRKQVIARYLSAEARAAAIPSSSLAITPANYRFRYQGFVDTGAVTAYVFHMTPRHKREGLIKGDLWIDAESGVAVRQSGYVVKLPSIFVKHIDVTRETAVNGAGAEMRITHLSLDTRLVGRAELTVREHPCTACAAPEGNPAVPRQGLALSAGWR